MEERAHWTALALTAQTGAIVTGAQLLGTDQEEQADREEQAEKDVKKLLRRMRKAEQKRHKHGG